jgi:hypothetical protein
MSKMTPKQKEMYFRLSYDYWMDWKTKPDTEKLPLERLGCFVNVFSMLENRVRVFFWTASFYEQFASEYTKSGDWNTISRKKYERFTNDPYPPNTPTNTLVNMIETLKTRHLVSNSERKELNSLIEFRNSITHQSMFNLNKITDEHIDRIMRCFRYIDRKLKSIRRKYLRREKELRGEK